jgi:hypothetical protein
MFTALAKRAQYKYLVGKSDERRPLGRPWDRCEDNVNIDNKELVSRVAQSV